jgi:hypothetical protein
VVQRKDGLVPKKSGVHVSRPEETRKLIGECDIELICKAWEQYNGSVDVFESAVGALIVGRFAGFDGLRVIHNSKTLRKYEVILGGVSFKQMLAPRTPESRRVNGIRYAESFKQFWKALAGGVASEPGAKEAVSA